MTTRLRENGVSATHNVIRLGILETLLEIAQLPRAGIELEFSQLPIPPIVSRFADAFAFDPMRTISSGTLAVAVPPERQKDVSQALEEAGTIFAFVGQVVQGKGVHVLKHREAIHYTEIRCEADELACLWALYPRDGESRRGRSWL